MAVMGEPTQLTSQRIEELRVRLRVSDPRERAAAVAELRNWQGEKLSPGAPEAAVRAATVGYPWVDAVPDDPGELLIQLLWQDPAGVPVAELERAYVFCAEKGRRAILRTLALRCDERALGGIVSIMGLDGPVDLLPVPTLDLLDPLLDVPGAQRLVPVLLSNVWRRGWVPVVARMLRGLVARDLLDEQHATEVLEGLAPLLVSLLDTCDRAYDLEGRHNLSRVDRERVGCVVPLLAELDGAGTTVLLRRVLASADPRVAATGAVALVGRGEPVGDDRLALIARDPEGRSVLLGGLEPLGRGLELPGDLRSEVAVAEADVVSYLAGRTQLGAPPDEIEHRGVYPTPLEWGRGVTHLFAFRVRPPHWSSQRGWMVAAAGPFDPSVHSAPMESPRDHLPRRGEGFEVCSLYEAESTEELSRHVLEIGRAVVRARSGDPGGGEPGAGEAAA